MAQPKNSVLVNPNGEYLVAMGDKTLVNTTEFNEAWISNYDTLRSVQGYINAVHKIKYEIAELTVSRAE